MIGLVSIQAKTVEVPLTYKVPGYDKTLDLPLVSIAYFSENTFMALSFSFFDI